MAVPLVPTRREAMGLSLIAAAAAAAPMPASSQTPGALIARPLPGTGERLPVIGLGTNSFGVQGEERIAPLREVIRLMVENGASVIDTSRVYGRGRAEEVIGQIVRELGLQEKVFVVTKARAANRAEAVAALETCLRALGLDRVPAILVQSMTGTDVVLPVLREWKQAGRIRYLGGSTSDEPQYPEVERMIREDQVDMIQIDYSVVERAAADRILPLALDRGVGVMVNQPFGGRGSSVLPKVANRPLPDFAREIGAASWAQLCLKYSLSHPAVTVVVPGTTNPRHLMDNLGAGRGEMPDADLRRRIERIFDELT